VGTQQEEHLTNYSGFSHIPIRIGDPHPQRQPQGRDPNSTSTTNNARARGKILLDFLNHHTLIIAYDRFFPSPQDSTYENK
jgi:phage-related protein